VILGGQPLQMTQQTQPRPEGHLLHCAKIQYCGQAVKSHPARVSEKKTCGYKWQPAHAPLRDHVINQQSNEQRIDKDKNAGDDNAEIAAEMKTQEGLDLGGEPTNLAVAVQLHGFIRGLAASDSRTKRVDAAQNHRSAWYSKQRAIS
jgi:hypothetical protein